MEYFYLFMPQLQRSNFDIDSNKEDGFKLKKI